METKVIVITPQMAKKLLERNHAKQRNLSPSVVTHYSQQMTAGQWKMNGEPVIFDANGDIMDGQHRLHAIVKSGVDCEMLVVEGVSHEVFPTINGGKPRTASNIMAIAGVTNYTAISTCVNGTMNYRRALKTPRTIRDKDGHVLRTELGGSLSTYIRPSKTDLLEEYLKWPEQYQKAVRITMKCKHLGNHSAFSVIAALAIIDGAKGEFTECFFDSLAKGLFDNPNSPEYRLRQRLEQNRASKSRFNNNHLILLIAKAWNYYATEQECRILRLGGENAFPIE